MEELQVNGTTIENMGVLDLIEMKPEDLGAVSLIQNVGLILAPESLVGALMKIPQKNVGLTVTLPSTTGKIKLLSGQFTVNGEVFANRLGSPEDILVVTGQIIITSTIETVGFKEVIVAGQLIAPKKAESGLVAAVTRMTGQVAYYTAETPRLFVGEDTFSKAFFDFIDDKLAMVFVGSFEFESDVDAALLKQKVSEIVVIGELKAPKELIPILQYLASVKLGSIIGIDHAVIQSQP
ncbi:hypothetical protein [Paenibacillus prosopidis]|uniref:Uncharacterized protein n=1 Tax=Paenibacillus prosopidis TaxID=630520 RepID=A0A368VJ14_9BACL|nr:hypothetical protein [Paenibacillus prosopidis]RCW41495.1 hypothetical protein DFP97_12324 [Paenibacillus prosopidis]